MTNIPWTPWHEVVALRPDLRSGELPLAIFAADLYDVVMQKGLRPVYEDPAQFFALTYPTYNLRELAREVVLRLAGQNDKAVRQLELTYGGGKTHTLITLYHLAHQPQALPHLPAVQEFIQHIGVVPPKARIATLTFDKLDVEKGMETRGPAGELRWLKHPWSVLAFQIAGSDGLRLLHADDLDDERASAPAENLLAELLALPGKDGLATLVLIDEVLMYAREKVGLDGAWRSRLVNFFQYLTQAVVRVDRAALVASLLATDPRKSDSLGKEITQELYAIFRREREESVQPVLKEDVSEVLRRRFFTPESIRDREAFRPHVVAALKGVAELDSQTQKEGKAAEERFLHSYPFHPDLTDIFYTKWTGLEGFQRTRGVLRTFALALREAETWDDSPLIDPSAFLAPPGHSPIAEATRELTNIATVEEYEGKHHEWNAILQGELEKAVAIQQEFTALQHRELEQAVLATFLHSQPIGQKALTRELLLLVGPTRPDRIELEKALRRWAEVSWFLDEAGLQETDDEQTLPKTWRLGSKPNLRQMHHDACRYRVPADLVEARLIEEIEKLKSLAAGASGAGVKVHTLPAKPANVEDDGDFHYVILGPKAASEPGKPSAEARRYLDEVTGPHYPRVYRNAILLAVPSLDGLEAARARILELLGWEEVRSQLKGQALDPIREQTLAYSIETDRKKIPDAIRQAYCLVVTVSEKNEAQAFRVQVGSEPLFTAIKKDPRSRIQEVAVNAEALLPGGPYDLWHSGESARWLKDLAGAFAQHPHLPKMLNRQAILDTLVDGCRQGLFVLRLKRPDQSYRTFWRQQPDELALKDKALEVVLPEAATLAEIDPELLTPGVLPGLFDQGTATVHQVTAYFSGQHVVQVQKEDYSEPLAIPGAESAAVEAAIGEAVRTGRLWLTYGPASILGEEIPAGLLAPDALLQPPPPLIGSPEILPAALPEAWQGQQSTALALMAALSTKMGLSLPWVRVRAAIDGTLKAHLLELALDSGPWPCDLSGAQFVKLRVPAGPPPPPPSPGPKANVVSAEADLRIDQLQDLVEALPDLQAAAMPYKLKYRVRIEMTGDQEPPSTSTMAKINDALHEALGAQDLTFC